MVFFNDPVAVNKHELAAIRLALAARERFEELARVWRKRGTELGLGVGIEAGYATVGRIGFEGRYDYAALGSVTNLASRLSTHASAGQILVGPRVFAAVEETVNTEAVGSLDLEGVRQANPRVRSSRALTQLTSRRSGGQNVVTTGAARFERGAAKTLRTSTRRARRRASAFFEAGTPGSRRWRRRR